MWTSNRTKFHKTPSQSKLIWKRFVVTSFVNGTSSSSSPCVNEETSKTKRKSFVSDRGSQTKIEKKKNMKKVFGELNSILNEIKKNLSNDGNNELIQFLKKNSAKTHVLEPDE